MIEALLTLKRCISIQDSMREKGSVNSGHQCRSASTEIPSGLQILKLPLCDSLPLLLVIN